MGNHSSEKMSVTSLDVSSVTAGETASSDGGFAVPLLPSSDHQRGIPDDGRDGAGSILLNQKISKEKTSSIKSVPPHLLFIFYQILATSDSLIISFLLTPNSFLVGRGHFIPQVASCLLLPRDLSRFSIPTLSCAFATQASSQLDVLAIGPLRIREINLDSQFVTQRLGSFPKETWILPQGNLDLKHQKVNKISK